MFRDNLKAAIKWSALPCCLLRIIYYILEAKDLHKPKIHMGNTSCSKLTFSRPKSFFEVFLFFVLSGWDIILFGSWYSKKTARRQINDNRQIKYYWFDGFALFTPSFGNWQLFYTRDLILKLSTTERSNLVSIVMTDWKRKKKSFLRRKKWQRSDISERKLNNHFLKSNNIL